ncbi:MAG: hypothetical protein HY738_14185 [Bacteroidia bacterium]|nr:hypothetical protein [Bacteroidia bacterium]
MRFFSLIFVFFYFACSYGQIQDENIQPDENKTPGPDYFELLQQKNDSSGKISIIQADEIRWLVNTHIGLNEKLDGFPGFRIEIFSENGYGAREAAQKARKEFILRFPEIPAYESYDGINFKVRAGDFRTKSEAMKAKYEIISDYPYTFIVKELIKYPIQKS